MQAKGQSALEFLNTYSFVFIIIAIALAVLVVIAVVPRSTIPSQCTFYSGFSCSDSGFSVNSIGSGSIIYVLALDQVPGTMNITSFNAVVSSVRSTSGSCSVQTNGIVQQGSRVFCTAALPLLPNLGGTYLGAFSIKANYCPPGSTGASIGCPGPSTYLFVGSTTVQAAASVPTFTTTTTSTTTSTSTTSTTTI